MRSGPVIQRTNCRWPMALRSQRNGKQSISHSREVAGVKERSRVVQAAKREMLNLVLRQPVICIFGKVGSNI